MRAHEFLIERIDVGKTVANLGDKIEARSATDLTAAGTPTDIVNHIVGYDPTPNNKYTLWIIKTWLNHGIRLLEDLPRTQAALEIFHKHKSRMPKKDINQIKSLSELEKMVEPFYDHKTERELKADEKKQIYAESEILHKSELGMLVVPKTERASCFWGQGTQWCTAATRSENLFDRYNKVGPLYIWIEPDGTKYQFHFESGQYMDEEDTPIDEEDPDKFFHFLNNHPIMSKLFAEHMSKHGLITGVTFETADEFGLTGMLESFSDESDIIWADHSRNEFMYNIYLTDFANAKNLNSDNLHFDIGDFYWHSPILSSLKYLSIDNIRKIYAYINKKIGLISNEDGEEISEKEFIGYVSDNGLDDDFFYDYPKAESQIHDLLLNKITEILNDTYRYTYEKMISDGLYSYIYDNTDRPSHVNFEGFIEEHSNDILRDFNMGMLEHTVLVFSTPIFSLEIRDDIYLVIDVDNIIEDIQEEDIMKNFDEVFSNRLSSGEVLSEVSPPGDRAEKWIRDNKDSFKRQYGKTWAKVLYATAWKKFGYKSRPKAKRRDQD